LGILTIKEILTTKDTKEKIKNFLCVTLCPLC